MKRYLVVAAVAVSLSACKRSQIADHYLLSVKTNDGKQAVWADVVLGEELLAADSVLAGRNFPALESAKSVLRMEDGSLVCLFVHGSGEARVVTLIPNGIDSFALLSVVNVVPREK